VRDVQVDDGRGWQPVAERNGSWFAPGCPKRGCRVRYRYQLERAADALGSEAASRDGAVIQAPPSTWLLHPLRAGRGKSYRFHVTPAPGVVFATGVYVAPNAPSGTYEADIGDLEGAPYSAFGPLRVVELDSHGGRIEIAYSPSKRVLSDGEITTFIKNAADVVGSYYKKFPIERVLILVSDSSGHEFHGRTLGNGGATILLGAGDEMTLADLPEDWVVVHEMTHLAFPSMPRPQTWIEEGLATYVEPIARARMGQMTPEAVWGALVNGAPNGLPERGDRGLDRTHTWGRTYWGGALYCLLADVEIRERTNNQKSLDDALRAIVAAGGNIGVNWSLDEALAAGDRATGVPVLVPLRSKMGSKPMPVDLAALWRRLGIRRDGRRILFDDTAPLAALRRSITAH
jgi:hypothetical protein